MKLTATLLALLGLSLAPTQQAKMIQPNFSFSYVPGTGLPQHEAKVFYRRDLDVTRREIVFGPFRGGGWAPGSGVGLSKIDPTDGDLIHKLWLEGYIIVSSGYTTKDTNVIGDGLLDPGKWDRNAQGEISLNSSNPLHHCAELDLINLIQATRRVIQAWVPEADIRPGTGGIIGTSAGSVAPLLVALKERAEANALGHPATSTKVGWVVAKRAITSLAAPLNSIQNNHLLGGPTFGDVLDRVKKADSPYWSALNPTGLLETPIYFWTDSQSSPFQGTYSWDTFQNILGDVHSRNHIDAIESALKATGLPAYTSLSIYDHQTLQSNLDSRVFAWIKSLP